MAAVLRTRCGLKYIFERQFVCLLCGVSLWVSLWALVPRAGVGERQECGSGIISVEAGSNGDGVSLATCYVMLKLLLRHAEFVFALELELYFDGPHHSEKGY